MLAIMQAESSCQPDRMGDTALTFQGAGRVEGMSCGLLQVRVLAGRPDCAVLQDPAQNVAWAWKIYQGQGLGAWSAYINGSYAQFL